MTRQELLKALASCGQALIDLLIEQLAATLPTLKGLWTCGGKVNLAVDGTKFKAPRTAANQEGFAAVCQPRPVTSRTKAKRRESKQERRAKGGRPRSSSKKPPRTTARKYCSKAAESKASSVQILVTVFWHLASGLPLRWLVAEGSGGERKAVAATQPFFVCFVVRGSLPDVRQRLAVFYC